MTIASNVPEKPIIITLYEDIAIGDKVRIQMYPKDESDKKYPYSGAGMIGKVEAIHFDSFVISLDAFSKTIMFDEIFIIRKAGEKESFYNTPFIDDKEREFWHTHWRTPEGIKEKTAEDIKMLEEFNLKF